MVGCPVKRGGRMKMYLPRLPKGRKRVHRNVTGRPGRARPAPTHHKIGMSNCGYMVHCRGGFVTRPGMVWKRARPQESDRQIRAGAARRCGIKQSEAPA